MGGGTRARLPFTTPKEKFALVISNVTRYICHLRNVASAAGEVDLGRGLSVRQLPEQTVRLVERLGPLIYQPWEHYTAWFLVNEHLPNQAEWVDGDPSGALRVFRLALLLYFSEAIGVGAPVHVKMSNGEETAPVIHLPRWAREPTFSKPDEYVIRPQDVAPLKTLFGKLVGGLKNPLLNVPLRWLSKACEDRLIPSDAVINLSVALEALYLEAEYEKAKTLAQRGAVHLGSDSASREQCYVSLVCLYRARNRIVHEGDEYPVVSAGPAGSKSVVELCSFGFSHARQAIERVALNLTVDKAAFVSGLRAQANTILSELDGFHARYFS